MLPPDISKSLPWGVMVLLMQIFGSFPYRMSVTSGPPTFSVPLCLLGVFEQVFVLSMNSMAFQIMFLSHFNEDIGTATYICSIFVMLMTICSCPVVLAMKSPALATLLHDMSTIKEVSQPSLHRWYCQPLTLVYLSSITMFTIVSSLSSSKSMGFSYPVEKAALVFVCFFCGIFLLLPEELPSMVFGLLARRLLVATEDTVAKVSTLIAQDGSFKGESDVDAAMMALRDLDTVIHEVEEQRERAARCFFPVISMYLLMGVCLAITCPYAHMRNEAMGGSIVGDLLIPYYIMVRFCHLGQSFVRQVGTAQMLLKNLRVRSLSFRFSLKVSQVVGSLSGLLTFDMCGWYRLDYAALLGLINMVLTYLVILYQVGGSTVDNALSLSPATNSSALPP